MTRLRPVRAYWRRLPNKVDTTPHLELLQAFERDQYTAWLAEQIAAELDRDFRDEVR